MINETLDKFYSDLNRQLKSAIKNLKHINATDLKFVKIERVIWTTKEGFYGKQPKRLPVAREPEYLEGVNMTVFIDKKWSYVIFNGDFGYRFKINSLDVIKHDFLKGWGEPRTLGLAKEIFDAEELCFRQPNEETKNVEPEKSGHSEVDDSPEKSPSKKQSQKSEDDKQDHLSRRASTHKDKGGVQNKKMAKAPIKVDSIYSPPGVNLAPVEKVQSEKS